MFGQVNWTQETRIRVMKENKENFKPWDGLKCRTILWDEEAEVATVIYLCETVEALEKAKERVKREKEKLGDMLGYFTELNTKVLEYKQYK